ncbi:hypothetical protein EHS25_005879 [Saitozyma podzolica]|uniref:Zn(2)-C6 fungal-type domain-containing protein n=1 Tax=Saitozyma podzolica TaxID=1890683 RepID=A0A427XVH9_9TREE|nr:hypothetical protein EHS25_005879 [Saitozyma podzolica]
MSLHLDYAEISRQARRIVDANRAKSVIEKATGPSPDGPRKRVKYSRSTNGCLGCRKQKVKCDETTPVCLRCVAAQRACEYPESRPDGRRRKKDSAGPSGESGNGRSPSQPGGGQSGDRTDGNAGAGSSGCTGRKSLLVSWYRRKISWALRVEQWMIGHRDWMAPAHQFDFLQDIFNDMPDIPAIQTSPSSAPAPTTFASASSQSTSKLPQVSDMTKSSLLNRRAGKNGQGHGPQMLNPAPTLAPPLVPINPRLMAIEALIQAFAHDETLFEFGPSNRHQVLGGGLLGNIDLLSNAFPSPTARTLFHHYCNVTSRFLITMGNIGPNPLLALCTPLNLLDTSSAACAAIRMSMLSISVTHFVHETEEAAGVPGMGPAWSSQKSTLKAMSDKFKKAAVASILLAAGSNPGRAQGLASPPPPLEVTDVSQSTVSSPRASSYAYEIWRDNLEFALNLINKKGGPQVMLRPPDYSFTRRYLLENLATHDEPALLGSYDTWWFDSVETSQTRWEWESVERSFGVSRAMVDLVARIAVLDTHKRRLGISLKSESAEMTEITQHFQRESQCLLLELDIWGNSLNALPQHARVTCGDYIYKYMATVFILADVLEQPPSTPRVSQAVNYVLELCSEASAMRMSVMLIWPLLIAGVFALPNIRPKVSSLFDAFKSDYCEDLATARVLLEEQWRCIDAGKGKQPWQSLMTKLGRSALLI